MENETRVRKIYEVTLVGSVANLLLLVFKFVAGILGASAAMVADAVHSLSDFLTDIVVLIMVKLSSKKADADHAYGHGKYETLATVVIGVVLFCVGLGILRSGVASVLHVVRGGELPPPGMLALVAAVASVVVKELLYRYTARVGRQCNSTSVVANAWHHRSDAFSSIGTMLGIAGAILLGSKWSVLDPLAAVIVSFFILKVSFQLIRPGLDELLEKSLPAETEERIRRIILSVDGVSQPHHLRTRRIGNRISVEVHVRMDGSMTLSASHVVACHIERLLRRELGAETYVNIHMEPLKNASEG